MPEAGRNLEKTNLQSLKRRTVLVGGAALAATALAGRSAMAQEVAGPDMSRGADNFYKSNRVNAEDVRYKNTYGMEIVGTLFTPKQMEAGKKYSALVVGHPYGAVRQQAANLYATKMAEQGFVTLTFDQSFWGESAGSPRGAVLPDVYTENFSSAVDFLGTRNFVSREKIGVIGICASGGFSLAAAKIDPRIKAVATVSMYDMGEYYRTGINNERAVATRNSDLQKAAANRYVEFEIGKPVHGPGQNDPVFLEAKEFAGLLRDCTRQGSLQQPPDDTCDLREVLQLPSVPRHRFHFAASDPVRGGRNRSVARLHRNCFYDRGRAERACRHSRCEPHRSL